MRRMGLSLDLGCVGKGDRQRKKEEAETKENYKRQIKKYIDLFIV